MTGLENKAITTVKDLKGNEDFALVSDPQFVEETLEHLGVSAEDRWDIDFLFTSFDMTHGKFREVYGGEGKPHMYKAVVKLH